MLRLLRMVSTKLPDYVLLPVCIPKPLGPGLLRPRFKWNWEVNHKTLVLTRRSFHSFRFIWIGESPGAKGFGMLHIAIHDRAVWSIPILNKRNILALYKSHVFSSWTFCSQVSFSAPRCFLHEKIPPESRTNKHKLLSKSEQDPITEREVRSNFLVTFFNPLHGMS